MVTNNIIKDGLNISVPKDTDPTRIQLGPGLSLWYGLINEEYLTQLQPWSRAAQIFREMSDDAIIGAMLEAIKTPLLSTSFLVNSISENSEDKRAATFVEDNLFNIPDQEWLEHVEDMLEFLQYGFAISEKVLAKKPDGKLYLRSLIPIGQETLYQWGSRDDYGDVTAFVQRDPVTGKLLSSNMDKLLHFTWRTRKRSPLGNSLLRSLYRPWYFKKNLETLEAIGVERDVGNVPVAELASEFYSGGNEAGRLTDLKTALQNFRMDETAYLILPQGVKVHAYVSGSKAYDVRAIIRDWQHIIRQRFFADFLALGSEQVGTQSLAKEMNTFFKLALVSVQRRMLEVWNRQLIPYLFKWNNWELDKYPTLAWNDPSSINIQSLAQAYGELVNVGLLEPTELVKRYIREQLRLPIEEILKVDSTEVIEQPSLDKGADNPVDLPKEPKEAKTSPTAQPSKTPSAPAMGTSAK